MNDDARSKLTVEQVEEIKNSPYRTSLLAKLYKVSPARISQIRGNQK